MQIILHIGQPKTASTTIQLYCERNRKQLAAQGALYPTSLGGKKAFIAAFLNRRGRRANMFSSPEEVINGLRAEFADPYHKAILSDETIYQCRKENKLSIKDMFGKYATSWRVLCYVRRPDDHIVSSYQQAIRNNSGFNGSFEEFYVKRMADDYYNYNHQMEQWAEIFGRDAVEVRVFHRKTLQGGPVEDFIRWIGLDPATLPPDVHDAANESVDRVGTEILRFLNDCEAAQRDFLHGYDLDHVREQLRALISDDRLRLDTKRAKHLQDQFRKDHEELAARYLTPDHAAILLEPPAEQPVQPPIALNLVSERMRTVFDADVARLAADEIERRLRDEALTRLVADEVERRLQDGALARLVADEVERRLKMRDEAASSNWIKVLRSVLAKVSPVQRSR